MSKPALKFKRPRKLVLVACSYNSLRFLPKIETVRLTLALNLIVLLFFPSLTLDPFTRQFRYKRYAYQKRWPGAHRFRRVNNFFSSASSQNIAHAFGLPIQWVRALVKCWLVTNTNKSVLFNKIFVRTKPFLFTLRVSFISETVQKYILSLK